MGHFATSLINCSCQGSLPLYGTFYWKWNIFDIALNFNSYFILTYYLWFSKPFLMIVYKKTDEWYIEWQRVTKNDNEWQRVTTSSTTSDKEWQRVIQRVTTRDKKWQWVTASDRSGTTNENGPVHFKEWMIAILSMTKTDTLLLQGMDGCN